MSPTKVKYRWATFSIVTWTTRFRLFLYLFIPTLAGITTWGTAILAVSYSAGELGPRTPSFGFPFPWMTVGHIQGCMAPDPFCLTYDTDWFFLTLDMLLYSMVGFSILIVYLGAIRTGLPSPLVLQMNWRSLKAVMIVVLLTITFEPIVAVALSQHLPCVNCLPKESITLDSFSMNSPTNLTLSLRNVGPITVSLTNYEVQDSQGNQWWRIWLPPNQTTGTWWSGPTISPNATGTATITIGSSCGNCTYRGAAGVFTQFSPDDSYTVTMVTGGNYRFAFPIMT